MDNELPGPLEPEQAKAPVKHRFHIRIRWPRGRTRDIATGVIAASVAGGSAVAGLAHLPWVWILLLCAEIGVLGAFVTHAVTVKTAKDSQRYWRVCFLLSLVLPIGAFTYHELFDSATQRPAQLVANGSEENYVSLYGEAGGQPQALATGFAGKNGFIGGQTYEFECSVMVPESGEWLRFRRGGRVWWAPRKFFHSPVGVAPPEIRSC